MPGYDNSIFNLFFFAMWDTSDLKNSESKAPVHTNPDIL